MKFRLLLFALLVVAWLLPFYCVGAMLGLPFRVHSRIAFQYSAAGLFTRRVSSWNQPFFQVRTYVASGWKTIDTSELSPMGAFGFRQRLDRVLLDTSGKKSTAAIRLRLAEWVAREYSKRHPGDGEVIGVRFGQTTWESSCPGMASPSGAWMREPVDVEPSTPFRAYATFNIIKGKAEVERQGQPAVTAPPKTPKVFERKAATGSQKGEVK